MGDLDDSKLRSLKYAIEQNSDRIQVIVDQLVAKFNKELDQYLDEVKQLLLDKDKLSDTEVELITLKVPVFMYFGISGVENLGIQLDNAKTVKNNVYNDNYMNATGTINDKTAEAENNTISEALMVVCYERAYKKLKGKMDAAEQICNSTRKVLQKRITDASIRINDREIKGD